MSDVKPQNDRQTGILNAIERIGNAMPDITMLFIYALGVCWALSFGLSFINFDYFHPLTGDQIKVTNMLAPVELVTFITTMVKNLLTSHRWRSPLLLLWGLVLPRAVALFR